MPAIKKELWDTLVAKRGPYCEMCHWNLATDPHHCIVKRSKNHPEYDCEENIELLCSAEHTWGNGYVNSYEHKVGFWERQKKRGYDMKAWYDSLNLKHKENYEQGAGNERKIQPGRFKEYVRNDGIDNDNRGVERVERTTPR